MESRLIIGLWQFELYTSVPVAAWMEGVFTEKEFSELAHSEIIGNVLECAGTITIDMNGSEIEDQLLRSSWVVLTNVIDSLSYETRGRELARKAFVVFFTAIAIRNYLELLCGEEPVSTVTPDEKRIAVSFFERARDEAIKLHLPIELDVSPEHFLLSLDASIHLTNWI